jgi:hypothetical protein
MTKIIFDEYAYAEELLKNGFKDFIKYADILILAKYFRYLGYKPAKIKNEIVEFYKRSCPDYNEVLFGDKINDAIKKSGEHKIKLAIDVFITKAELESIESIKNYKYEKILFVMLAVARYSKLSNHNPSPRYFVNHKFSTVLSSAKVYATKAERDKMKHYLFNQGMIRVPEPNQTAEKNKKETQELLYANENSEVAIVITDMNNVVLFYPFHCEVCGKLIEQKNNHNTMCPDCAHDKRKELQRNAIKNKRWNEKKD